MYEIVDLGNNYKFYIGLRYVFLCNLKGSHIAVLVIIKPQTTFHTEYASMLTDQTHNKLHVPIAHQTES